MSSAESRPEPDNKIQLRYTAGVVQPDGSESKEAPNPRIALRAESLLAAKKRTLEMIADGASLNEILNDLCSSIDVEASPVISSVLLMDPDGGRLWHTAGTLVPLDWLPVISPLTISPHAGCCGAAAFSKERVIVADVATDINWLDEHRDLAIKNGIRAAWSEPILTKDGEVLGTFALYSSEPRTPTDGEIELIEGAGHIALIAIERQRSHQALEEALVEIKNSENKLRTIIDTIPALAWSARPDGSAEFFNRRWLDYAGLTGEEVADWGWTVALHPEDRDRLMDYWRYILASGETGEIESRLRRFDGEFRWFLFRASPLRNDSGKVVKWYGTNTDIDDRKRAKEELEKAFNEIAKSEAELRTIIDAIPQLIVALGADGKFLSANQALLEYTGLTKEDVRSERFGDVFHPEDTERLRDIREAAISRGVPFEYERRVRRRDGQYRWLLVQYNPLRDEAGQIIRWYATGTDIHDRKQAEERTQQENFVLREQIDQVF